MPGALRIGLVYDALYPYVRGGVERRNHELATRLAARGHDVHVVTWRFWDGPALVSREGLTLHGVGAPPPLYGTDGKRKVHEAASFAARILPVLLRVRLDIIDCAATPFVPLYAAWLASRMKHTALVVTWHEYWGAHWHDYLPHRPAVARIARLLESWGRRVGEARVAVSPFTARRLATEGEDPAMVVGNGVDLAEIGRASRASEAFDVLFVGRLIDEKRVDLLLEAVGRLRHRLPGLRCGIIGDGPERSALERQAARLGIAAQVTFLGALPDAGVFSSMKAARLLVLPSIREGFGITVVEAQACGAVPVVVASPTSAAPDLVRDGIDGRVCAADATSLADTLAALLAHPSNLRAMAARARTAAAERDWSVVAEAMERTYLAVAARTQGLMATA